MGNLGEFVDMSMCREWIVATQAVAMSPCLVSPSICHRLSTSQSEKLSVTRAGV